MREVHEFPAVRPLVETWLEHCEHSRAAWRFLADNEGAIADEYSAVQAWTDDTDRRLFAWCHIQQLGSVYVLRVQHLNGPAASAMTVAEELTKNPRETFLEAALDILEASRVFPGGGYRDALRYVKKETEGQLLELTIDALDDTPIAELGERYHLLSELLGYCNALGA